MALISESDALSGRSCLWGSHLTHRRTSPCCCTHLCGVVHWLRWRSLHCMCSWIISRHSCHTHSRHSWNLRHGVQTTHRWHSSHRLSTATKSLSTVSNSSSSESTLCDWSLCVCWHSSDSLTDLCRCDDLSDADAFAECANAVNEIVFFSNFLFEELNSLGGFSNSIGLFSF